MGGKRGNTCVGACCDICSACRLSLSRPVAPGSAGNSSLWMLNSEGSSPLCTPSDAYRLEPSRLLGLSPFANPTLEDLRAPPRAGNSESWNAGCSLSCAGHLFSPYRALELGQ